MNGLAFKVEGIGFQSGLSIMDEHIEILKSIGKVYFSTDISIAKTMIKGLDTMLFYNVREDFYYLCKVSKVEINKVVGERSTADNSFIPEDANKYSVPKYADEPKKTWILLDSIENIDFEMVSTWKTVNENMSVSEKIKIGGRFPRFYFVG